MSDKPPFSFSSIQRRIGTLKWLVPAGLFLLVVGVEVGPLGWVRRNWGETYHLAGEILIYGTVGPILAFALLHFLGRWLEEKDTSELQAQVLARTREQARSNHQLADSTLQSLFAASVLLTSIESGAANLPPEAVAQLREAQHALECAIQQLHTNVLMQSPAANRPLSPAERPQPALQSRSAARK
jgi:signal transduction histidine kinase